MKETEFIKEYKKKRGLSNIKIAKEKIDIFWKILISILEEDKKLIFKGWGSFEIREIKEKIFINPKTKIITKIPKYKKIIFKQGKLLKERFNRQE